mmetsp:Transcript_32281/g.55817  ORF Transcript_32281/g.55817 Transcript_32281/m.55817 type:complete len:605 (-) Transcript_32281:26-1840(-)
MGDPGSLLSKLQSGELVKKLAEVYVEPLKAVNVASLLSRVGIQPEQVEKLYHFFGRPEFVGDPEDVIDMDNITLNQLVKRLMNGCLFQLWEVYQETDLSDFLRKYRGRPIRQTPTPWSEKPKVLKSFNELELQEIIKGAEANKPRITAAIDGGYAEALRVLSNAMGCNVDEATVNDFVETLNQLIFTDRVSPRSAKLKLDSGMLFRPSNFDEFMRVLSDWKVSPVPSISPRPKPSRSTPPLNRDNVELTIEETIKTYESLRHLQLAKGEDTSAVDSIIKACRLQMRRSSRDVMQLKRRESEKWVAKCKQGLTDIFGFYAKQVRMIGKTPSFAEIEQANQIWNLSKFLKFLKDFHLSELPPGNKCLSRVEGSDIFMRFAHLRKSLNEPSFLQALDAVAMILFNHEFDEQNGTQFASLSEEEKTLKLYEYLECDNIAKYSKKMKGFGLPFSSDTRCRMPADDPAKRYKFRASQKILEELNDWKKKNPRRVNLSSNAPKVRRAVQESLEEKSFTKKKLDISNLQSKNVITWKKLGEMSFEQLKDPSDDFDIRNLIVDSDSDDGLITKLPILKERPKVQESPAKTRAVEKSVVAENSYFMKAKHRLKA